MIWAIPGFLGLQSDWDFLAWKSLIAVDLYAFSWCTLSEWAEQFNRLLEDGRDHRSEPAILMGYSLGGRLALHALLDKPAQWKAAVIISAHPGLGDPDERKEREKRDQDWAQRFKQEEWDSLIRAWNAQPIFAGDSFSFDRHECCYERSLLAQTLNNGSLATQRDLREEIASLPMPILWITGGQDRCCSELASSLTFAHPFSRWVSVQGAGHRIPWEQPVVFNQLIQKFLETIDPGS